MRGVTRCISSAMRLHKNEAQSLTLQHLRHGNRFQCSLDANLGTLQAAAVCSTVQNMLLESCCNRSRWLTLLDGFFLCVGLPAERGREPIEHQGP